MVTFEYGSIKYLSFAQDVERQSSPVHTIYGIPHAVGRDSRREMLQGVPPPPSPMQHKALLAQRLRSRLMIAPAQASNRVEEEEEAEDTKL